MALDRPIDGVEKLVAPTTFETAFCCLTSTDVHPPCQPPPLTGVCKNEIIATNRPRHLWIPAYAGMMEWA